jgi:surfactin synthase thioesterase subunit
MTRREGTRWIRAFDVCESPRANIICFPYAAGAATSFRRLSAMLAGDVQTYSVQYPGRQDRLFETPYKSISDMADAVCEEIPDLPELPLMLLGHSMGAAVAFEVASRLDGSSLPVLGLVASARPAPSYRSLTRYHLADDRKLLEGVRSLNAPHASALDDEGLARTMLPTIRSDYRAIERYYNPDAAPIGCPINVLVGREDPVFSAEQAVQWFPYTTGACQVLEYPGGHFFIDSCLGRVVGDLRRFISRSL